MVYHKKTLNILVLFSVFQQDLVGSYTQNIQSSPCPQIFQYEYENGDIIGKVRVECPGCRKIQTNVEMSVGNRVEGYNGNIQLANDKHQVLRDVLNKYPIYYKVYFPRWQGTPPKITKILINGNLICSGPKLLLGLVPVLTTINLQHTLTIDTVPLSTSADPSPHNQPDPPFDVRRASTEPPDDYPIFEADESPFYSPPPPSKVINPFLGKNKYNFRPSLPKDPDRLYPGNPFLAGLVTPAPSGGGNGESFGGGNTSLPEEKYPVNPFFSSEKDRYPNNPFFTGLSVTRPKPEPRPESGPKPGGSHEEENTPSNNNTNPFLVPRRPPEASPSTAEVVNKIDTEKSTNFDFVPSVPVSTNKIGEIPYADTCGRTISTNSLIVNGDSVPRGAYPWLVAIFGVRDTGLNYMCSGSLISKKHVVTAAHCVKMESKVLKPDELLCVLGKLNIKKWKSGEGKMIDPEKIDIHPNYETVSSDADIAVLTLSEEVIFDKYIRPLCLWTGQNSLGNVVGKSGTVVGWGKDEKGALMTEEPKQIKLPIVSQAQCLRSNYQFQYITSNRTFCAGFRNGSGPCNGDSGSGLIMQEEGRWMLRGVVSMSISESHTRTCDLSNYVVFTDASKFLDWLLSFIK